MRSAPAGAPPAIARLAERLATLRGWRRWSTALLLGLAAVLALPPVSAAPILVLVLPALLWLLDGAESRRAAFAIGFWFGLGHFTLSLYWISFALGVDIGRFFYMLPLTVLGLPFLLALFMGLGTLVARLLPWHGLARPLALAVGWTAAEWLRGHAFTGFPWNLIGYAWTDWQPVIQSAALVGIYGVSLLTVALAALPAVAVDRSGGWSRRGLAGCAAGLVLAVGLTAWGAARVPHDAMPVHPDVRLRLVQPNIAQVDKWNPDLFLDHFDLHRRLSTQPGTPTHVIWAETAIPYRVEQDDGARQAIALTAPQDGLVITGVPRVTGPEADPRYWNGLVAVTGAGQVVGTYDKAHLVPFGEYVPFREWLPFEAVASRTDYSAGPGPRTLDLPGLPPVGPMICYEIVFPGAVVDPEPGAQRPQWLLNLTNDAWYGETAGPHQHFAIARVRAVEEGLALVRVANTGISGVVDPYGRITERLGLGEQGIVDADLPMALDRPPPYARYGDWAFAILWAATLGAAVGFGRHDRKGCASARRKL